MVPKRDGEIDLRRAAKLAGVRVKTVRTWARKAWDGNPTQLTYGRKDPNGQWFVRAEEIQRVIDDRREREQRIATQERLDPDAA